MARVDETNTSKLPAFPSLKTYERRAVVLKAEGKTAEQITEHINAIYALDYSPVTVKEWFKSSGRLLQAYHEYLEADAALALQESRLAIKRSTTAAVRAIVTKLSSLDERIQLDAAKTILNKYIPDRQVVHESGAMNEDVPEELLGAADAIASDKAEVGDGPESVDDARQSVKDSEGARTGSNEAVS